MKNEEESDDEVEISKLEAFVGEVYYVDETTNEIYDINTGEIIGEWDKIAQKPNIN